MDEVMASFRIWSHASVVYCVIPMKINRPEHSSVEGLKSNILITTVDELW